jgi:hypothetical protein
MESLIFKIPYAPLDLIGSYTLYKFIRSYHVRPEGLEILTSIQKRDEYPPLDLMKIRRYRLIQKTTLKKEKFTIIKRKQRL